MRTTTDPGAGPSPARQAARRCWPALLLVVVALAAHGNTVVNGFVWDDDPIIVKNPDTRNLSRLGHVLLSPDEKPPYYRPLNRATYLLDHALFGLDPAGFHLVNLLIHAAAVLALYAVGRRLFDARFPALLAALLLAVHPIGTEAIAFVSARNNLLALLFSLLGVALLVDAERRQDWRRAWLSGLAFFLGLASKEPAAMTLPVLALWLVRPGQAAPPTPRSLRLLAPHLVALLAYLALRAVSLGGLVGPPVDPGLPQAPLLSRLATNFFTIPLDLALLAFPRGLTIYHVLPAADAASVAVAALAWALIAVAVVLLVRQRSAPSLLGLAWFALGLVPASGLLALPTATVLAERYLYVPAAGLWLLVADQVARLRGRAGLRTPLTAAAALALLVLGVRSVVRNLDWRDDGTLSRAAVAVEPRAPMAQYNLGLALLEAGDRAAARAHWEVAIRHDSVDGRALIGLGNLAAQDGDAAAAERLYRAALGTLAGPVEAHLNLGKLYDQLGDAARARAEWETVLRAEPDHADALTQLGVLQATAGDLAGAERRFLQALAADPDLPEALFDLAKLCEGTGRPEQAARSYERFLRAPGPPGDEARRVAERRLAALRQRGVR